MHGLRRLCWAVLKNKRFGREKSFETTDDFPETNANSPLSNFEFEIYDVLAIYLVVKCVGIVRVTVSTHNKPPPYFITVPTNIILCYV